MSDEDNPLAREPISEEFEVSIPSWSAVPRVRPCLHERIQAYIDEVNPQKAAPREAWRPEFWSRTPGETPDFVGTIRDFTITVGDIDTEAHETLEEMPGPCIMCGEDEVHVTVERNPDGEIEETRLECHECGWRVTGGPVRFEDIDRLDQPDGWVDFTDDQA